MEVKNLMEEIVNGTLDDQWLKLDIPCKCDVCRLDVLTLVLNAVPPRYFNMSRQTGKLYSKAEFMNRQSSSNVLREVVVASRKVADSPSHDKV